jgi:hypothetical protein
MRCLFFENDESSSVRQNITYQYRLENKEKEKRAAELVIANTELAFKTNKRKRAAESMPMSLSSK